MFSFFLFNVLAINKLNKFIFKNNKWWFIISCVYNTAPLIRYDEISNYMRACAHITCTSRVSSRGTNNRGNRLLLHPEYEHVSSSWSCWWCVIRIKRGKSNSVPIYTRRISKIVEYKCGNKLLDNAMTRRLIVFSSNAQIKWIPRKVIHSKVSIDSFFITESINYVRFRLKYS